MSYIVVRGSSSDLWHQNEKLFERLKPYVVVAFAILVLGVPLLLIFQPIEALSTDVAASDAVTDGTSALSFDATRRSGDSAAFASSFAASSLEAGVIKGVNIAWSLCRAEAAYWADIDRRKAAHNGDQWPMDATDLPSLLLSVLMPTYPCPAEERVGAWGDGGKWVCMLPTAIRDNPVVYSVGSNEQYDFEQAIGAALHTKPFTFDPFLSANATAHMHALPFLHFNEIAIAGAASLENFRDENPGITIMTLQEAMKKLGHEYVDVLKMDCEGCEEEFIMGMKRETEEFVERRRKEGGALTEEEKEGKRRGRGDAKLVINGGNLLFGQLLVEFHAMHKPQQSLPYLYAMEGMGYRMFHVEPNLLMHKPQHSLPFLHAMEGMGYRMLHVEPNPPHPPFPPPPSPSSPYHRMHKPPSLRLGGHGVPHHMHKPQHSLPYLYAMEGMGNRMFHSLPYLYAMEGMGYRMFHVEPNPLCYPCIEVAFIHEDLVVPPLSLDCAGVLRRSQVAFVHEDLVVPPLSLDCGAVLRQFHPCLR
ncbi:unnamed protein product [Closterium sp. NIES-65]|nr:unnamed protein product [Closterium sp. NIES-65]